MKFKDILIAFFRTNSIAGAAEPITAPIAHLAAAGNVSEDTIWLYCRQADRGIGHGETLLDPKIAGWLIYESEKLIGGLHANQVRDALERKITEWKSQNQ